MISDLLVGEALLAGAMACVAAAALRRDGLAASLAGLAAAAALACAAAGRFIAATGDPAPAVLAAAACVLAAAAVVALVHQRFGRVSRLSWLDAVMGASSAAALAVALGAGAPAVSAAAGAAGGLALSRWRPGPAVVLALIGLAGLGTTDGIALLGGVALVAAVMLGNPRAEPGPDFDPVVLVAILSFASVALALFTLGQFSSVADAATLLADITMLTGMARAGATVVEKLRESNARAVTDQLTGLGNRRHLVDRLTAAVEQAHARRGELALLLVDLDGFKELNDTLGHHAGDEVLRQIGPRLTGVLNEGDTLARLGGDEFAVVLDPGDEATASAAGLRLRAALEHSFTVSDITVHIDASVGIALFPAHAHDALGLLQRADVAMYQAKRMRTGHEVYLPARDRHSRRRLALMGELRGALEQGQLVVHYQPKAEVDTGAVRGAEALVRWDHPTRGFLGPVEFLPIAEQSGLTRALTGFVLDRALEELAARRREGFDLTIAVNLGPADLLDLGLPSDVDRLLQRHGVAPEHLRLEVSEDVIMGELERTVDVLARLRAVGVGTALDDFGAGHASLGHLKRLEVDELKIDRSFVIRLGEDDHDAAIVHSTIDLARRLGLRVVAEGVETAAAWALLGEWGCDEAQGHFVGPPMSAPELAGWLRERSPQPPAGGPPRPWAPMVARGRVAQRLPLR